MEATEWLSLLPIDIWAELASILTWRDLYGLALMTSKSLNLSMSRPGVVSSLNFVYEHLLPTRLLFPSLRHLTAPYDFFNAERGFRLSSIPKSLIELKLTGFSQPVEFLASNSYHIAQVMPNLQSLTLGVVMLKSMGPWIQTCPNSLTFLKVAGLSEFPPLPPSLRSLNVGPQWKLDPSSVLPPNLEELRAEYVTTNDIVQLMSLLPQSLELLEMRVTNSYNPVSLPRTLKSLLSTAPLENLKIGELPPTLTIADIWVPNVAYMVALPTTLTDLTLRMGLPGPRQNKTPFLQALPQGLQRFRGIVTASEDEVWVLDERINWPPTLTTISLSDGKFCEAALASIPFTITHLRLQSIDASVEKLPTWSLLRHLELKDLNMGFKMFQSLSALPLLNFLCVHHAKYLLLLGSALDSIEASMEKHDALEKAWSRSSPTDLPKFGNQLKYIKLDDPIDYMGDCLFNMLPLSLTKLSIESSSFFSDSGVQRLQNCPNLLSLSLQHTSKVTGASFKYLPRNLTQLSMDYLKHVSDPQVLELPRTLRILYLNSATELTNACACLLPPLLSDFSVRWNLNLSNSFGQPSPSHAKVKLTVRMSSGRITIYH